MASTPKWFVPVVVVALLWNLLGCMAYLSDVTLSPEAIARMSAAQQAAHAARPAWSVGATAIAVWFGALGCLLLLLRKRIATALLVASLVGVIAQDIDLFVLSGAAKQAGPMAFVLQGLVLLVALGLVALSRKASSQGWLK